MGFFVGMVLGVRDPFKLPIKQKQFRSAATNGSREQLDQLAKGEVWVQNSMRHISKRPDATALGLLCFRYVAMIAPRIARHIANAADFRLYTVNGLRNQPDFE